MIARAPSHENFRSCGGKKAGAKEQNGIAIDVQKEEIISLMEVATGLPAVRGKRPATCTLWRWCR